MSPDSSPLEAGEQLHLGGPEIRSLTVGFEIRSSVVQIHVTSVANGK